MTLQEELALSYYRDVGTLNEKHGVTLVRHNQSGQIFIKKTLTVYNAEVYRHLKEHPIFGTPRIIEAVESGGRLTVIEQYISGKTLAQLMQIRRLTPEEVKNYFLQLCNIVAALHRAVPAIIHRDIKPSNILLAGSRLYLLDMNAARPEHEGDHDTVLIGTVGYAAPEQYGFGTSDKRTDIYALGVLYHEMLTGDKNLSVPVSDKHASRVIATCTQMDPARRYERVEDLITEVKQGFRVTRLNFLPPGFRTKTWWKMILGGFGYIMMLALPLSAKFEPLPPGIAWTERVLIFLMFLSMTLLSCNYLSVWDRLGVRKTWLRILLIILGDFLIVFAVAMASSSRDSLAGIA